VWPACVWLGTLQDPSDIEMLRDIFKLSLDEPLRNNLGIVGGELLMDQKKWWCVWKS
jgi:hypothetical protein